MEKIGIKYGLLTTAGLIVYFLIMDLLGLTHYTALHFLNGIILTIGVVMAIRGYKQSVNGQISYFKGLGAGIITSAVATLLFAVFMVLYVKIGSGKLLKELSSQPYLGEGLAATPGFVIFMVLMMEGVISGVMISFIAMQFFKRDEHKVPGSP
ncbi:DUF4199 domain-containing protein [Pontibacter liquoris]|uniref:DUF4199 domain-containing protein n=1 Tax=Pontibacter liquoris TaxID=2905677 RepID=UPI001FA72270|nr:DUF4199 domain-containing protein [Pontibacter liquoris]